MPAVPGALNRSRQYESMESPSMTHTRQQTANGMQCFTHTGARTAQEHAAGRVLETDTHASAGQDKALLSVALQMTVVPNEKGAVALIQDPYRVDVCSVTAVIRPALGRPKHGEPTEDVESVRPETGTVITGGEQKVVAKKERLGDEMLIAHDRVSTNTSIASSPLIEDNRIAVTPGSLSPGPPTNSHSNSHSSRLFQARDRLPMARPECLALLIPGTIEHRHKVLV